MMGETGRGGAAWMGWLGMFFVWRIRWVMGAGPGLLGDGEGMGRH